MRPIFIASMVLLSISVQLLSHSASAEEPMLSCEPSNLGPSDTLVLRFKIPHPAELAIRAPGPVSYFLVYKPSDSLRTGWKPLLSKDAFLGASEIHLAAASAEGTPWVDNRPLNERIFTAAGDYEVVLTDVLESDADRPLYSCVVRFAP